MYFDPFEPIREETAGRARAFREHFEKRGCSDDLLLAENESLRIRVAELEKTVSRQQSELMLLQTTSADLLRRLAKLEATQNNGIANSGLKGGCGLHSESKCWQYDRDGLKIEEQMLKRTKGNGVYASPRLNDSISSVKGFSNTMVNVSVGKSSRGSPLRKWMSHQNVKGSPSSTNLLSESTTSGRTTPSLVSASHHQSSWTVPRSIS
ncbi:hypothetical protein ANCCAN_04891 [Ancylostoma caninum]|uniref:Uncharacterized protein n=1 Tax=Ancylostoma caninum TaxID=29170 RepID=A0A368GXG4_ANCCA|nr:hypothetical protein ANCCAN_04891 [Ancylostoma caninum]